MITKKNCIKIITICLFMCITFSGCNNTLRYYSYRAYGTYENFSTYQSDFECISELVRNHGEGVYYINIENAEGVYGIQDSTIITIEAVSSSRLTEDEYVSMSEDELESLKTILMNSYGYDYNFTPFVWIMVTDTYVFFEYDAIGSGIVQTSNMKDVLNDLGYEGNNEVGYGKLEDDWYGVYR